MFQCINNCTVGFHLQLITDRQTDKQADTTRYLAVDGAAVVTSDGNSTCSAIHLFTLNTTTKCRFTSQVNNCSNKNNCSTKLTEPKRIFTTIALAHQTVLKHYYKNADWEMQDQIARLDNE